MILKWLSTFVVVLAIAGVAGAQGIGQAPIRAVADINGRATLLVKPEFPESAIVTGADGDTVLLNVIVDENGNVVSATCMPNCHPMLKDAAELAAMTSKFKPLVIDGHAVKYRGILVYNFVRERVNWLGFGGALESTRQFDNISFGPVAQMLSKGFASEKASLKKLDADGGADYEGRQKGITDVERSLKLKLKGADLWHFDLGMAMRRVTFWISAGRLNRSEMQKAIDGYRSILLRLPMKFQIK